MGERVLKNRLFMHRFYVKAVGFMHCWLIDMIFLQFRWFWGVGFGRLLCEISHWKRSGIKRIL
ncbi:hypothetical protein [Bartonella raoultii]|nr:hypothetical protein [Bartonella raoultii]